MSDLNDAEKLASHLFRELGLVSHRLEERTDQRTADFLIEGAPPIIVEVTGKSDSGQFEALLARGSFAEEHRVHRHSSTVKRVLRDKKEQLIETRNIPGAEEAFLVLLVAPTGRFAADIDAEIVATFLGRVGITVRSEAERTIERSCYLFDKAECFEFPHLAGVVIAHEEQARILLNPASPVIESFRETQFVRAFDPGIVDIEIDEATGEVFSLGDYRGPRGLMPQHDRDRRAFIEKKYGLTFALPLRWNSVTVATNIHMK
jgi:hypothetical protein